MKRIFHFVIIGLLFVFFVAHDHPVETTKEEWMIRIPQGEEAESYADAYNLELIHVSPSGIARFYADQTSDDHMLIEAGFTSNTDSTLFRPPWQRTEDPYLNEQYALDLMQTKEAWDITTGSADVTVAIIDTGIDSGHDEFTGRISPLSYNAYFEEVGIDAVEDDHGHGTMVAGVIGAIKDNSKGIAGIAQNVELLVIKANTPGEENFKDSVLIESMYYAVEHGADLINLSLGGTYANDLTKDALDYAKEMGVIVIAASGNEGNDERFYPAAFEGVLAVSAVDENRQMADFSNYGTHIDLSAPGFEIVTTTTNNGYVVTSGTSFAAPQVTGVLALSLSHHTNLEPDMHVTRLFETAMDEGDPGKDVFYGHGIVNTYDALATEFVTYTFETFDGEHVDPMVLLKDQPTILPTTTKTDHVFDGWYFDEAFTIPWIDMQTIPTGDATLYAKFDASHVNLSFVSSGTQVEPLVIPYGTVVDLPKTMREGYDFLGWSYEEERYLPYQGEPLYADTVFFAFFEMIRTFDVELHHEKDVLDVLTFEEEETPVIGSYAREGHDFFGWYLDPDLTMAYEPEPITSDLVLYGDYRMRMLTVSYETFGGDPIADTTLSYGEIAETPTASRADDAFFGWYLDDLFLEEYAGTPVTEDTMLYARFVDQAHTVTYVIDGDVYLVDTVEANKTFELLDVSMTGYVLDGWYLYASYETLYSPEPIDDDLVLYGRLEEKTYDLIFYDFDRTSVHTILTVPHGGSVELPDGPFRASTASFDYRFDRWEGYEEPVLSDQVITPRYQYRFKPESVSLNPGIDTIVLNDSWFDAGVTLLDPSLEVVRETSLDTAVLGTHRLTYAIWRGDVPVHTVTRFVRVIEENDIGLELRPGIDTIHVGDRHIDRGLEEVDMGDVETTDTVDPSVPGTYTITYRFEVGGLSYSVIRYVHVIGSDVIDIDAYTRVRKEDEDENL